MRRPAGSLPPGGDRGYLRGAMDRRPPLRLLAVAAAFAAGVAAAPSAFA